MNKRFYYIKSTLAIDNALSSTLVVDLPTINWTPVFQSIDPPNKKKYYPCILFIFGKFANNTSFEPLNIFIIALYNLPNSSVYV
jgi:hypothetical protein